MGDEKRTFQVLLHMVGHLLNQHWKGSIIFRVVLETGAEGGNDKVRGTGRPSTTDEYVTIKFEIEVSLEGSQSDSSNSTIHFGGRRHNSKEVTEGLSFSMCKKLVQVGMNGVMRKPVLLQGLAGELQRLLQSGGGGDGL
ncbi:hypothetical protein RND71_009285 [Anisodus tanguticus]|uniref:Uncharacterized protein n=1 Tax=Anisodus tanguticus TaxID=243964 RepID=A0AAE1SGY3_9SOLA|nr:hypothetical protein RND71_009285 [Anisodus tanguticus]